MSMNSADLPAATRRGTKEVATFSPEPTRAARTGIDVRSSLLDEYLDLKERVKPLEKRLEEVRDRLLDLVTEHGHFIDEVRSESVCASSRALARNTTLSVWRRLFLVWRDALSSPSTLLSWRLVCGQGW